MDDNERRMWVENDEDLYNWFKSERMGLYQFVINNRAELTQIINNKLN